MPTVDLGQIKSEINEVVTRYCRGVDRRDWELVRSCYHPDAIDDHGRFVGGPDEFVEHVKMNARGRISSNHCVMNHWIMVEDSVKVSSETYTLCFIRSEDPDGTIADRTIVCR